jgi:hypothetical protein
MECKEAAQLSDLETAIFLLHDALIRRLAPHPHRIDSLNDLAEALTVRFWHTGQPVDLDEAIILCDEIVELSNGGSQIVTNAGNKSDLPVRPPPAQLHWNYVLTFELG